jgi:ATP-dependent DNA helicase PIF1
MSVLVRRFADRLLQVGDGLAGNPVAIEDRMLLDHASRDIPSLVSEIYGNLGSFPDRAHTLSARAIVTPLNKNVGDLNDTITAAFPGEVHTYNSTDMPLDIEDVGRYDSYYYTSQSPQGLPPSQLNLKIGMPVMLLRNLDQAAGLANGTRLTVTRCELYVVRAKILTGTNVGTEVLIPRVSIRTDEKSSIAVQFARKQFPLRPAFVMSINKSQIYIQDITHPRE